MGLPKATEEKDRRSPFFGSETVGLGQSNWSFEDKELAEIFEHYVRKHVPFYDEIHRMISEISDWFVSNGGTVYDLGTSTGETVLRISDRHPKMGLRFVAVDASNEMIQKAEFRLKNVQNVEFIVADLNDRFVLHDANLVTAVWVLQFLKANSRPRLLREIYSGLMAGGALLMAEKITARSARFESMWNELYHDMKRRNEIGEAEITAKAASIRGVLIPQTLAANTHMIRDAGFRDVEVFFKWYDWVGILAVKT